MNSEHIGVQCLNRLPVVGLLLIATVRFRELGKGTRRGPYNSRKEAEVEHLNNLIGREMKVCFPGIIYEQTDLRRAMERFQSENVDFVVAEYLSWAEDASWIEFLRDMTDVPILFVHIFRDELAFSTTDEEDDFIEFLCTGTGLVGTLEASGAIKRVGGKHVTSIVGNLDRVLGEIRLFGKVAAARNALRHAAVGLVGNYNEVMWSTYVDPYNVFTNLGPKIHFIGYSDLVAEIAQVPDSEAIEYVRQLRAQYEVLPTVDVLKFLESARASLALARIAARIGLQMMALNDVDQALLRAIGLRPGFYPKWFHENGCVLVPEGDLGGALAAYLLNKISKKHISFMEPSYIDSKNGCFVAQHGGPNDHTEATSAQRVKIAPDVRFAKSNCRYPGAPFAWYRFSPGLKTMVHVSECHGRFKMVCSMLESLDGEHFLAGYCHGVFRPPIPVVPFFERLIEIGTTQHFVVAEGDWRAELRRLAEMTGMEFHAID